MKIVYCMHSVYNPGGMERVLLNKVSYLSSLPGWDVSIVTTDQGGKPPFYPFPEKVRMTDLHINYSADNDKGFVQKTLSYLRKRQRHRKRLEKYLMEAKADLVVSLYPSESSFIPSIKDGSKKILELHFNRYFRLQYNRAGLMGLADKLRTDEDLKIVSRFDSFVVLTEEDRSYWGNLPNIEVIPNAAMTLSEKKSDVTARRVIAVGRLDYQKSFDRLLDAWKIVCNSGKCPGWKLDIFGQGEWKEMLEQKIKANGMEGSATINPPTGNIGQEYVSSSILAMTSHYEGFPMVMIEAMACGLPVVTFNYKCGPADIIRNGKNGIIIEDGDIVDFAEHLELLMKDEGLRKRMSAEAQKVTETYSEEKVMARWLDLFSKLTGK